MTERERRDPDRRDGGRTRLRPTERQRHRETYDDVLDLDDGLWDEPENMSGKRRSCDLPEKEK